MYRLFQCPGLLLVLLSGASCGQDAGSANEAPRPVKVETAVDAATLYKDFAGMSTPDDAVTLAFKIAGQVSNIPVSKGQNVKKGELIAELDPRETQLTVDANRTAYNEASSQLQRMKRLLTHQAISMQEYESANTRYAQMKSAYENSLSLLSDTKIRAPFAGVIEATYVDTYERVGSGQAIARLVNPSTLTVSFTLPENAIHQIELPSTRFSVRFDNYRGVQFDAVLKNYAKTSADASGFPASLTLLNVDSKRYPIAPGMSCTITMQTADGAEGAVSLPLSAIYAPAQGGTGVWVVGSGDRVTLRHVTLGQPFGSDRILITGGLSPGERVVTAGVYRLKEGQQVRILN